MKKKGIINFIIMVVSAVTALVLILNATTSWFEKTAEYGHQFEIHADGVLYIYIPASVEDTHSSLTPAIAMPYAVQNGKYIDVLKTYDQSDANPSWVSVTAGVASYSTNFVFYNQYTRKVQAKDEFGNPIFDEEDNPVYEPELDPEGNPIVDQEGNPVYKTEPSPANISYTLAVKDSAVEDEGNYIPMDEFGIKEFYFSYKEQPIAEGLPINEENGALPYLIAAPDKTSGTVRVEGTKEIFIHMKIYLANPDELMDPILRESTIYLEIGLAVVLEGFTPPED
jgi:hypothetical protein